MTKQRHEDLDRLKGLAIFLVVLGHLVSREPPEGVQWFVNLRDAIYLFHMPLFMFLSGLILGLTRKPIGSIREYGRYVRGKFVRLMPAYLGFSALVFLGKALCGSFLHVDNPVVSAHDYLLVLIKPHASFCAYLWYIYVLFVFYAAAPIAYWVTNQRIYLLLPICLAVYPFDVTRYFALSGIAEYSLVFTLGCLAGDHYPKYSAFLDRYGAAFVTPFLVAFAFAIPWDVPKFVLGLLSIPACHAMIRMDSAEFWGLFKTLGKYTFPIYLMNTVFIGVSKGVMLRLAPWDGLNFLVFAPVLLLTGILGPILVKRLIIARNRVLNTIVA